MRVLILGGTGEARALAAVLVPQARYEVTSSLAGRVTNPALPVGTVRVGGFGGVAGLVDYVSANRVDAIIDATHPFAAAMSAHAAAASAQTQVPLIIVRRRGWFETAADRWIRVPDITVAAATVAAMPAGCVFVTTGRRDLAAFAGDVQHSYLVRTVDPPIGRTPPRMTLLLDRGPFTVGGEAELMRGHDVLALVTKDSGGEMTTAKITAARERAIPVVMVDRPALPAGVRVVETVEAATAWLDSVAG